MLFFSVNAKFALRTRSMTSYNLSVPVGWKHPGSVHNYASNTILLLDFSAANLTFGHIPVHKIEEALPAM